jgi:hypothetical protein
MSISWLKEIMEHFFLLEEKRAMRTRKFHRKNTFQDLFRGWAGLGWAGLGCAALRCAALGSGAGRACPGRAGEAFPRASLG